MNNIDERLTLPEGQGYGVNGQGQICKFVKELVSTIYHEPMIGY